MKRFHYRRSLASRVTLLATIAVAVSVAVVALAAFMTVRHQMQQTLDESLLQRAQRAASSDALPQASAQQIPSWALGAADVRIIFVTADRRYFSADTGPTLTLGEPELAVAAGARASSTRTITASDVSYRVVAVPSGSGTALVLAQSLEPNDRTLGKLGIVLLLFGAAGVIGAALAGWAIARSGLRPVRQLTHAAEEIARTEELDPIEVEGNDEIARLATAFNAMLLALSASRDRQRQLVADAGHELRTPLTSLRTNIDLLVQADERGGLSKDSRCELLDDIQAQIEELTTLIGDLVELARDEPLTFAVEAVDLAEITDRAVARVRRRASGLRFDVHTEPWWVEGESVALERAITNLLDNAAKWSPPLGVVTVTLAGGRLLVADQGRGIADEDLAYVFDRFFRSRESRTMPGSGLGLAIVRQVAERHGGTATAGRSADGGAEIRFEIPGSAGQGSEAAGSAASDGSAAGSAGSAAASAADGSAAGSAGSAADSSEVGPESEVFGRS